MPRGNCLTIAALLATSVGLEWPAPATATSDAPRAAVTVHTEYGRASGFLVDARGIVLTDVRILRDAKRLRVQLDDSTKVEARLLARYDRLGVAVVHINPAVCAELPVLTLIEPEAPAAQPGTRVVTLHGPGGVPAGQVSGTVLASSSTAVDIDIPVSPAQSGGPLVDVTGTVLGMACSTRPDQQGRPRPARIIPAAALRQPLGDARKLLATAKLPSAKKLAVVPRDLFPSETLDAAVSAGDWDLDPYRLDDLRAAGRYVGWVYTPPLMLRLQVQAEAERARRLEQADGRAAPDTALYDPFAGLGICDRVRRTFAPVVVLELTPQLTETERSRMQRNLVSTIGDALRAIRGGRSGFLDYFDYDLEFAVDLVNFDLRVDGKRVEDLTRGIAWLSLEQLSHGMFDDVGAVGLAAYDPRVFLPREGAWPKVDVIIESTDKPGIWRSSQVSQRTLEQVALDFEPWFLQQRARRWSLAGHDDPATKGVAGDVGDAGDVGNAVVARVADRRAGAVCELARGMPAAAVRQQLGTPARVVPLRAGAQTDRPWDAIVYEYLAGRDPLYRSHKRLLANRLVFATTGPDTALMCWELEAPAP